MSAETGPIRWRLISRIYILADTGESQIYADKNIFEINPNQYELNDSSLQKMRDDFTKIYAATDEKYKEDEFNKKGKKRKSNGY